MLKFTSEADLLRLNPTSSAYPVISDLVNRIITDSLKTQYPYDPESDGFIALIEPDDINRPLTEIWDDGEWRLTDIPWEGITKQEDMFLAIYLANDQYGIIFVIPDADWVTGELRHCIEENLDP